MDKYEISIFLSLFIFSLALVLIFQVNGLKIEFVTFFVFAFFYITQSINKIYKEQKNTKNGTLKANKKIQIISASIFTFTLLLIGIIHILGDLNYPEFLVIDGWDNEYIIATRIVGFIGIFCSSFLREAYDVDNKTSTSRKQSSKKIGEVNLFKITFGSLMFPTISVPLFVSAADYLGIDWVRQFITSLLE